MADIPHWQATHAWRSIALRDWIALPQRYFRVRHNHGDSTIPRRVI
ncbi:protein of unknown function [Burkholderia multivorans]